MQEQITQFLQIGTSFDEITSGETMLTLKEATTWAKKYTNKNVTLSNISYLIQYGAIRKFNNYGMVFIKQSELKNYYDSLLKERKNSWSNKLGKDLNWKLSFDNLKETDTTKHVHRLHPYKGKFIPQLVEYFLDSRTDELKKEIFFAPGDIVLDPFAGSGTTLVQANELGMHAIGVDISEFNAFINNCKIQKYDFPNLQSEIDRISKVLSEFVQNSKILVFDDELNASLNKFNTEFFPVPEFKFKVRQKEINGDKYGTIKALEFSNIFKNLITKYDVKLLQNGDGFLKKWFIKQINDEMNLVFEEIKKVQNQATRQILMLILSRTIRSCRATTHADLTTLKEPIMSTYYCRKHGKICKPIFTILKWWERYCKDTLKRLKEFDLLRSDTYQYCISGDSRNIDIIAQLPKYDTKFAKLLQTQKIRGIFSSPPYVGLINYHEQHAYAYDLFGFTRNDELEIGPLFKGQGEEAKRSYIKGISDVLNNTKRFLVDDFDIFLVANDKYNLYPQIAECSSMKIVNQFKRPVLNRTEKNKNAYAEIIFHLRRK